MVNFAKKLKNRKKEIIIDPIKIYESLDRQTTKVGPLRKAQIQVLKEWFEKRLRDKDIILKLNTGAGKTLIGLLILESKLHQRIIQKEQSYGIEVFLCNNNNLVMQTIEQAKLFGINAVTINTNNEIPSEVINGEKILITSVQKFFNGKSIFEHTDSPEIDTIIIDDAHASAELIKQSCTLTITKEENAQLYTDLFYLVSDGLQSQGEGTFEDLKNNITSDDSAFLPVPYWTWIDKVQKITQLIASRANLSTELKFVWPILENSLSWCNCIVSANSIEITSLKYPIDFYTKFTNANQRVFMSATTASDAVLINDLGVSESAIKHPLIYPDEKWSGEKMVIIPSLISADFTRGSMVHFFGSQKPKHFGITIIVPGYYRSHDWKEYGAIVGESNILQDALKKFSNNDFQSPLVLVNRYDGIDLPDDETRILILDSLPNSTSLFDKYIDDVIPDGSEVILRKAQKIEQGMGRSVRADTDYSAILFIGSDLVRFIRNPKFQQYFSKQTLTQIKIGIDISKDAKSEYEESKLDTSGNNEMNPLIELIGQSLKRDEDWKEFYKEQMGEINYSQKPSQNVSLIVNKNKIMELAIDPTSNIEKFTETVQEFIDEFCPTVEEKGWYLQLLAHVTYKYSKSKARNYQVAAYKRNHKLLLPDNLNPVKRIEPLIAQKRLENIINQVKTYKTFENLQNTVNEITSNLSFGTERKKFEKSMDELGKILGFETDRPDENYKKGPDNLWSVKDDLYFIIEDKSEVLESRDKIYKEETGQMNNSTAWFEENYPGIRYRALMVIPTKYPDSAGGFNSDVRIIRSHSLKLLKKNFINFTREFRTLDFSSLSADQVSKFVVIHKLEVDKFIDNYSEKYYR